MRRASGHEGAQGECGSALLERKRRCTVGETDAARLTYANQLLHQSLRKSTHSEGGCLYYFRPGKSIPYKGGGESLKMAPMADYMKFTSGRNERNYVPVRPTRSSCFSSRHEESTSECGANIRRDVYVPGREGCMRRVCRSRKTKTGPIYSVRKYKTVLSPLESFRWRTTREDFVTSLTVIAMRAANRSLFTS